MPLIKLLRYGQITLPKKIRESLNIREGDVLEAELEQGRIVLTPKTLVDQDQAWEQVFHVLDTVHKRTKHIPPKEAEHDAHALVQQARKRPYATKSSPKHRS
jgi:AbrB family looped-hinge helix DNA binding protein